MAKVRVDILVYSRGLAPSREKARAMVLAGEVMVNGVRVDKPGTPVDERVSIDIHSSTPRYVSRGGIKLEKARVDFQVDFTGQVVMDVGASTGGYTDCALQQGANRVYAIDVGYGQLDWSLRQNPRVINMERTNIRYLTQEDLPEKVDIITIDVSFISTRLVFPVVKQFMKPDACVISLIKPQFEAGKDKVGKKGVVRDQQVHEQVLLDSIDIAQKEGLNCRGVTFSPITGPQGNIEFFILLRKDEEPLDNIEKVVQKVVTKAHNQLGG
ncbi:TlyA family RNA methyltransferase [Syntrophomonas erecta]